MRSLRTHPHRRMELSVSGDSARVGRDGISGQEVGNQFLSTVSILPGDGLQAVRE